MWAGQGLVADPRAKYLGIYIHGMVQYTLHEPLTSIFCTTSASRWFRPGRRVPRRMMLTRTYTARIFFLAMSLALNNPYFTHKVHDA